MPLEKPEIEKKRKVLVARGRYPFEKHKHKPSYVKLLKGFKSKTGNPGPVIAEKCRKCGVGLEPMLVAVNRAYCVLSLLFLRDSVCRV